MTGSRLCNTTTPGPSSIPRVSLRPAAAIIKIAAGPWISAPEPHDLPISVL
jgi:hypothetical protein